MQYIWNADKNNNVVLPFGFLFLERNDFFITLLLFFHLILAFIWNLHYLALYSMHGTEESNVS